jgi:hypothetical protein
LSSNETNQSVIGRLPATIEVTDLPLLNEGLAFLFQELGNATALYQLDPQAGREGIVHSVETVIKFLSVFAPVIAARLHAPLGVLFDALMSLDDGMVSLLLKPAKRAGRARASALRKALIGAAVFTVERFKETGMEVPPAHKTVASILKAEGVKLARGRAGTMTARTIRGWCAEVSADVGRHGVAAQTYDRLISTFTGSDTNELPPADARELLLSKLAQTARAMRAHEGA